MLQDLRYGARMLRSKPGFTLIAILTLSLGIGANTAIFSVVTSVLLAPLPFADSDRLMRIYSTQTQSDGQTRQTSVAPADFHFLRARSQLLAQVAASRFRNLTLTGDGEPERLIGIGVSDQWLETLGVRPLLGRGFDPQEQAVGSQSHVALLSYAFWRRRFGGQPEVIGRTLRLNEQNYTVIGVMPAQFRYPYNADLWMPVTLAPTATSPGDLNTVARLKPGVTEAQFGEELRVISADLAREFSGNRGVGLGARPFHQEFRRDPNRSIAILLFAVGFVLLLACVNVANLQLACSQSRAREMAIRAALGASRGRQLRQLLTESLLLAALGGVGGVLLAWVVGEWLTALIPSRLGEVIQQVRLDTKALAFSLAACLLTGILFGLAPALRLSQSSPLNALRVGGRSITGSGKRLLRALVVAEVALAVVLLVGAGLMAQNFARLLRADVGYDTANLLKLNLGLPEPVYHDPARRVTVVRQVLERLEAVPGVVAVGATTLQPIPRTTANNGVSLTLETQRDPTARPPIVNLRMVSPSYFRTVGMRVQRGRAFTAQDTELSAPVVIVNEAAARKFWSGENPLERRLKPGRPDDPRPAWHSVVGVVNDIAEPSQEMRETIYLAYAQGTALQPPTLWLATRVELLVRASAEAPALLSQLRSAVAEIDRTLPLFDVTSMETALAATLSDQRLGATLFIGFGAFGLLMAALGTYGVIAFSVSQRIQEFGVRLALGAQPSALLRLVMKEGFRLVGSGLLLGAVAALGLSRLLDGVISEVSPRDPLTFAAVALMLLLAGGLACYLPARRAAKVDPMIALRCD